MADCDESNNGVNEQPGRVIGEVAAEFIKRHVDSPIINALGYSLGFDTRGTDNFQVITFDNEAFRRSWGESENTQ